MTIINNTSTTITILAKEQDAVKIEPNDSFFLFSRMYDGISIHSEIGSCIISVAFGKRSYELFGNMVLEEEGPAHVHVLEK